MNISLEESEIDANSPGQHYGDFVGNYSSLMFTLALKRSFGFYLLDYYFPSILLVAVSWVSFWLQADQTAPRAMLGTSAMLAFITLSSSQNKPLPKVSYIKFSEIWFIVCALFIFASLVEFAFVNLLWAEVARWRNGLVLRYLIIAIPTQRSWVRDWVWEIFHLSFFESYVLEMRLTAFLCRLQTEMSSKEWFGSHYKL
ncbi:hypothetical protein ACKWTF_001603 [Chironomus riparius]